MSWRLFEELQIARKEIEKPKHSYSVTSDIISYKVCPRQYGFFNHRGYKPAHNIQMWFGLTVHQVLNKLYMQYSGLLDPARKEIIPNSNEVEEYFEKVCKSLRTVGIREMDENEKLSAKNSLKEFNRIEGPKLYPNIIHTEYKFQSDVGSFILEGIVDVLKNVSDDKVPEGYAAVEILDYKASKKPSTKKETDLKKLKKYQYQMFVYAKLYHLKNGSYPRRGILYFMNELNSKENRGLSDEQKRQKAALVFDFTEPELIKKIDEAMIDFEQTVNEIEICKTVDVWKAPESANIHDTETCDGCDIRWNCPSVNYQRTAP